MGSNFISVNKDFKIEYTIEYIDNQKDIDYIKNNKCDAWEYYKSKKYDNIQDAINYFLVKYLNSKVLDFHFIVEYTLKGELLASDYIIDLMSLNSYINKYSDDKINKLQNELNTLHDIINNDIGDILKATKEQKENIKTYLNNQKSNN